MRVSSTVLQNSFGKYLKMATGRQTVIVTRNGRDIACLVPCTDGLKLSEPIAAYDPGTEKVSYQAFLERTANSDERCELINGAVYQLALPTYDHQAAIGEIFGIMHIWFKGKSCKPMVAPFDVILRQNENNIHVVQPDILVLCDPEHIDRRGNYTGVPALVVEVLSPASRRKDLFLKLDLYLQAGVKECWLVDPDKKAVYWYAFAAGDIVDYQIHIGESTVKSTCFAGLEVALSDLFAG